MEVHNQAAAIMRNMTNEIASLPTVRREGITKEVANYVLNLISLLPSYTLDRKLSRDYIEKLIKRCEEIICQSPKEILETLKLQVYYYKALSTIEEARVEYNKQILSKASSSYNELINDTSKKYRDIISQYNKIANVALILQDMGSPSDENVEKEFITALRSVFRENKVRDFMQKRPCEKKEAVNDLSFLVAGIRIYNRSNKNGGYGIEDVPTILKRTISSAISRIKEDLRETSEKIQYNSLSLKKGLLGQQNSSMLKFSVATERSDTGVDPMLKVKHALIFQHQKLVALKRLSIVMSVFAKRVDNGLDHLNNLMQHIRGVTGFRVAIETSSVYPAFIKLGTVWKNLQEDLYTLRKETEILDLLLTYRTETVAKLSLLRVDSQQSTKSIGKLSFQVNPESEASACTVVVPSHQSFVSNLDFEINGFCIVSLVDGKGALLKGDPFLGVCEWRGKLYVFNTSEAIYLFTKDPVIYRMKLLQFVRENLELVELLSLRNDLAAVADIDDLVASVTRKAPPVDADVQTDLHPELGSTTPQLTPWRELEALATRISLGRMRTRSTQTNLSNFRANVLAQKSPAEDKSCQTRADDATNTPVPRNFVFGLRGRGDKSHMVIQLTQPVYCNKK